MNVLFLLPFALLAASNKKFEIHEEVVRLIGSIIDKNPADGSKKGAEAKAAATGGALVTIKDIPDDLENPFNSKLYIELGITEHSVDLLTFSPKSPSNDSELSPPEERSIFEMENHFNEKCKCRDKNGETSFSFAAMLNLQKFPKNENFCDDSNVKKLVCSFISNNGMFFGLYTLKRLGFSDLKRYYPKAFKFLVKNVKDGDLENLEIDINTDKKSIVGRNPQTPLNLFIKFVNYVREWQLKKMT